MSLLSKTTLPKDKPQIITTRLVAASRELVWKALTTPEHFQIKLAIAIGEAIWPPEMLQVFWCGERLPNQFAGCRN